MAVVLVSEQITWFHQLTVRGLEAYAATDCMNPYSLHFPVVQTLQKQTISLARHVLPLSNPAL